jgi:hypothetical protein
MATLQRERSCTFDAVQRFSIIALGNQLGTTVGVLYAHKQSVFAVDDAYDTRTVIPTDTSAIGNSLGTTVGVLYAHKQSVFAVDDAYATIKRADYATRHSVFACVAFRNEPTTQHDTRCLLGEKISHWEPSNLLNSDRACHFGEL